MNTIDRGVRIIRLAVLGGIASLAACGGGGDGAVTTAAAPSAEMPSVRALAGSRSPSVSVLRFKDEVAIADFLESSSDGCTWTYAQIVAYGGGRSKDLNVYGLVFDQCVDSYAYFAAFGDPNAKVVITDHAAFASGVLTGYFPDGSTRKVEIDLAWNGGVARTDDTRTVNIGPNLKLISRTSSSFKFADSVSGSFVIDGKDHLSSGYNSGVTGYTVQNGETTIQIVRQP